MPATPPALYVVRQDRGGVAHYVASSIGKPLDAHDDDTLAWTETRDDALRLCRSTARRLASVVALENGRAAMVLPFGEA